MRQFNKNEKRIIKDLIDIRYLEGLRVKDYLERKFFSAEKRTGLFFDFENNDLYLVIPTPQDQSESSEYEDRLNECLELFSLISFLSENRYISIFKLPFLIYDYPHYILGEYFKKVKTKDENPTKINDWNIVYIYQYDTLHLKNKSGIETHQGIRLGPECFQIATTHFLHHIFISEDLRQLVKNNFRTPEDRQFKVQKRLTVISIIVAILIGIISIILQVPK